jgi:hypothetical protein
MDSARRLRPRSRRSRAQMGSEVSRDAASSNSRAKPVVLASEILVSTHSSAR